MSYWQLAAFALACTVVLATLQASRRRYWIALTSYSVIVFGSAAMATFPMLFSINMANAFGPRSVSPVVYTIPMLTLLFFAAPTLVLFPFVGLGTARRTAAVLFGGTAALALASTVYLLFTKPRGYHASSSYYGQLSLLFLLLWLRIYDLRSKIEET